MIWIKRPKESFARKVRDELPPRAMALFAQGAAAGKHLVVMQDPDGCTRPTYKDTFLFLLQKRFESILLTVYLEYIRCIYSYLYMLALAPDGRK